MTADTTQPAAVAPQITAEERMEERRRHRPVARRSVSVYIPPHLRDICSCGSSVYPCIELRLLDALDASEAALAAAERELAALVALVIEWRQAHAWADNHTLDAQLRCDDADVALIDYIDEHPAYNDYLRAEAYSLGPASPELIERGMAAFRRALAKHSAPTPSGGEQPECTE